MDKTESSVEYSDKDEREVAVNTTTCSSEDNAFSNRPARGVLRRCRTRKQKEGSGDWSSALRISASSI
jgi:hypothetical protein